MPNKLSSLLIVLVATSFLPLAAKGDLRGEQAGLVSRKIMSASAPLDFSRLSQATQQYGKNQEAIQRTMLEQAARRQRLSKRMANDLSAPALLNAFMRQLDRTFTRSKSRKQFSMLLKDLRPANIEASSAGLGGTVLVDDDPVHDEVIVLAFDSHGYFAGKNETDPDDGSYTITGLANGDYYVVTWSENYVDEIYNDIQAPLHSMASWNQASLVTVTEDITEEINFNLESGAPVSGTITDATTGQPLQEVDVTINVLQADKPLPLFSNQVYVENGDFSLPVPVMGEVKIVVTTAGYLPAFYSNKMSWEDADIVNIASYSDDKTGINFALTQNPETAKLGGISGTVTPEGSIFPPLIFPAVVAAYSAEDTSFAALGIQLSPVLLPYNISNLPAGTYLLYANDYLGDVLGSGNYLGAWASEPVTVNEGQFVENIGIKLKEGGSISGLVREANGAPVDSLMILAIAKGMSLTPDVPFLTQFEFGLAVTKDDGSYKFTGLPEGQYILRTFSDFTLNFDLEGADNLISPGKHAGQIVDEYYNGVYNILDFNRADSVQVTGKNETGNIDFNLALPLYFAGTVTDAETGLPTRDVSLIAVNSKNAYPFWPFGNIDKSGDYTLGPLPPGMYKILAVTGFGRDSGYLTEFYNDKRSFYDADSLELVDQNLLNINFQLEKGAVLQGFVFLEPGMPTGAENMDGLPVVAYYADGPKSGRVASYDFVQFNGGYRINKLFPGNYKLSVLPLPSIFATTYYGGGNNFDDTESSMLSVNFGETPEDKNVTLEQAGGAIRGTITNLVDGTPLHQIVVIAYDQTGHAAGFALTGIDLKTGELSGETGEYTISGLRSGSYFVRTFAISAAGGGLGLLSGVGDLFANFDLANLGGGLDLNFNLDIPLFRDAWYPNVSDRIPIDLNDLLFNASAYGVPSEYDNAVFPVFVPAPFYVAVPGQAQTVVVTEGSVTPGVDIALAPGGVNDIVDTAVEDDRNETIVSDFRIYQNYPNPFNPETRIEYALPFESLVVFEVYNVLGQKIATLLDEQKQAGQHIVKWNGTNDRGDKVSAGIYLVRMRAGTFMKTIKVMLLP